MNNANHKAPRNGSLVVFIVAFLVLIVCMQIIWSIGIEGRIYNCTDDSFLGFMIPGGWVHGDIREVDTVVRSRDMSELDSIKTGWSKTKIWFLWISMLIAAFAGSWMFALLVGTERRKKNLA